MAIHRLAAARKDVASDLLSISARFGINVSFTLWPGGNTLELIKATLVPMNEVPSIAKKNRVHAVETSGCKNMLVIYFSEVSDEPAGESEDGKVSILLPITPHMMSAAQSELSPFASTELDPSATDAEFLADRILTTPLGAEDLRS